MSNLNGEEVAKVELENKTVHVNGGNADDGDCPDNSSGPEDRDEGTEETGNSTANILSHLSPPRHRHSECDYDDDNESWSPEIEHPPHEVDPEDENEASKAVAAALWPQLATSSNWSTDEFDQLNQSMNNPEGDRDEEEEEENEEEGGGTNEDVDGKHCWVCFASEEDDPGAQWTHPCKCRGTTKWIHQACIQRWVFEKQKGNMSAQVTCPQCGHAYRISYPAGGIVVISLDSFEKMTQRICPIMFGGLCVGTVYWFGITFGAVTIMQTVGEERGQIILERADPIFLIFALPLVPIALVLGRMIPWEEPVLKTLRVVVPKVPLLRNVLPAFNYVPDASRNPVPSTIPPVSNPICVTRTICSGLLYPSLAAFLGWTLYSGQGSQLRRTLLGGATVFAVEGALSLYHKQHTYIRHSEWKIQNYDENTPEESAHYSAASSTS